MARVPNLVLYVCFLFTLLTACSSNEGLKSTAQIEGSLTNSNGETIYLEAMLPDGLKVLDTAVVGTKGEFTFDGVSEPGFYKLKISDRNFATLVLDSSQHITVEGNAQDLGNTYKVKGSPDSELFWKINETSKNSYRRRDSLQRVFQNFINSPRMNQSRMDSLNNEIEVRYTALIDEHNAYLTKVIDSNPGSLALFAAIQQLDPDAYGPYYEKYAAALKNKYPDSPYTKLFLQNLDNSSRLAIGAPAPEISMNDPQGKPVSLSSLKGKVVLIDFWASWCGPCRVENPNVVKLYSKYKNKGFEIYGVSLDKDKQAWTDAIKKDGLNWIHVSDLGFWNSPVVKLYNFNSIPHTYLVDAEGKIIAKNLRGEDLAAKLEELFGKKNS